MRDHRPCATYSSIVGRWANSEHAHARPDIHHKIWIGITEVIRLLIADIWLAGIGKIVALRNEITAVDEVNAFDETIQFIKLQQIQV